MDLVRRATGVHGVSGNNVGQWRQKWGQRKEAAVHEHRGSSACSRRRNEAVSVAEYQDGDNDSDSYINSKWMCVAKTKSYKGIT